VPRTSLIVALRRVVVLVMASIVGLLAASAGLAAADPMPLEGVFENCSLDTQMPTCLQRLHAMHDGGVNVVVIPAQATSLASLSTYAHAAQSIGIRIMWELSDPGWWQDPTNGTQEADSFYGAYAAGCGCTENGAVLDYAIKWLGALPATYGYYAADDSVLAPGDKSGMAAYVSRIKRDDQVHTVMIASSLDTQQRGYEGISDVIGSEIYPVTTTSNLPVGQNQATWNWVGQQASESQRIADQAGKQSAFILQAFTWGDNLADGESAGVCKPSDTQMQCYDRLEYPAPGAQLELRNEVLEHAHPKLILWWSFPGTYGQAGTDTYSIYPTGSAAAARWQGLSAAIQAPAPSSGGGVGAQASRAHRSHRRHRRHHRRYRHHRRHRHHRHHHHRRHRHHRRWQAPRQAVGGIFRGSPF
jgi:hypothetical protein